MEQTDLLRQAIDVLERIEIPYMVVGSVASGAYGEPRLTRDIDIVVDLRPDQVDGFCAAFPAEQYYVSSDAARQAVRQGRQFNLIHPGSGHKVDFMVARQDPFGRTQMMRRRRAMVLPDREGYIGSPDDIIISKMQYYKEGGAEKHLRDITGILKVSGDEVDRAYVQRWVEQLGLSDVWEAVLRRVGLGQ